jgi:flagellin-like hook-associated protein FlgL
MVNSLNSKSMEKLSSGLRINRAADDAAGLAISETMRSQIRGLNQASRNSQDAISLLQTAEGALTETHSILHRMRELAVQAANATYTANDRSEIQKEIDQLKDEVDRIANTTSFNNKNLLDGTASAITSSDKEATKIYMRGAIRDGSVSAAGTYDLEISLDTGSIGKTQIQTSTIFRTTTMGGLDASKAGVAASGGTALYNVDRFYDANGRFLLDNPQTITLVDGTGKKASVTIFGNDTLSSLAKKLNNAISGKDGLDMGSVSGASGGTFAQYVTPTTPNNTAFATSGTFVLSSAVAGNDGKITVVASEQLINAFGFTEYQAATENTYTVKVTKGDQTIADNVKVEGNNLIGIIHANVDVKFASDANVQAAYANGEFTLSAGDAYSTKVHLADNTQVFQIGANELQNMGAAIGRMDSEALGINGILVTDAISAGKAITKIDEAISRVSSLRSDLGAVQNRLEHTINNLGVAAENITASESRIRDVDMAQEMMEFTKLNILTQASTAMLAQANSQPQSVLQLIGG